MKQKDLLKKRFLAAAQNDRMDGFSGPFCVPFGKNRVMAA